jgi:predicted ArsR family transcriptional regulator
MSEYNLVVRTLTVRHRVLAYLVKRPGVSAAQIGHALNISAASVRHHLAILRSDRRVLMWGEAHDGARGRPVKVYRASDSLLGDNLSMLSHSLLNEWPGGSGIRKEEHMVSVLAQGLLEQIGRAGDDVAATKKLASLIEGLNSVHYEARWEAGADGPRILLGHCPYSAIIERHPELCRMDAQLLEKQMDARANQVSKISTTPGGPAHCIFVLRK